MKQLRRIGILLEIMLLFGPATLFLFMSPIGLIAAIGSGYAAVLLILIFAAGGVFGLFSVINLAAHYFDADYLLPRRHWLLLGVLAGVTASVGCMVVAQFEPFAVLIFGVPIVGTMHLLWLCRGERSKRSPDGMK